MNLLLLVIYIISLGLYFPLNRRPSRFYFSSKIDNKLPLIPNSVWVYCSYYLLHPLSVILLWSKPEIINLLTALIVSTLLSSFIWYLFPNGVKRPSFVPNQSISQKILSYIYSKDNDSNGFPSGHISHTIICCYFLSLTFPQLFIPLIFWCITICIATLTTKQHYLVDYIFTPPFTFLIINLTQYAF